ncbi:unnamed protein product [Coffea canephora]|uniref:Ubiquitin-like protease family profile domain-containing protein n=1 Tax=Coffea canephora TaxID=49390 RepID=A0A068UF21_COFCA|nr:unnamed protein product [Coffea canephora]
MHDIRVVPVWNLEEHCWLVCYFDFVECSVRSRRIFLT